MTDVLVGQWRPKVRLYAQNGTLRASFTTTKNAGDLVLPRGDKGVTGDPGIDSAPYRLVGKVATQSLLPTGWTPADHRKAMAILDTGKVAYWTGADWLIGGELSHVGAQGDPLRVIRGPVDTLDRSATAITASLTTVDGGKQLSLAIPTGPAGPAGPAGPSNRLIGAADLAATVPKSGDVLMNDGANWAPTTLPPSIEQISVVPSFVNFQGGKNIVSIVSIPSRPYATRLIPLGAGFLKHSTDNYAWWGGVPDVYVHVDQVVNGTESVIGTGSWEYSNGYRQLAVVPFSNATMPANVTGEVQVQVWINNPVGPISSPGLNAQIIRVPLV